MIPSLDTPGKLIVDTRDLSLSVWEVKRGICLAAESTYIASAPRVSILEPRASNVVILLIHHHVQVLHCLLGFFQEVYSRCTGSHEYDANPASCTKWFFTDAIARGIDFWDMKTITFGGDLI